MKNQWFSRVGAWMNRRNGNDVEVESKTCTVYTTGKIIVYARTLSQWNDPRFA